MNSRQLLLLTLPLLAACGHIEKTAPDLPEAALQLVVTGLPEGTSARVQLTSPEGQTSSYQGSTLLEHLEPGTYAIRAGYVTSGPTTYQATLAGSVQLVDDDTAAVTVAYGAVAAPTLDLSIGYVQLIQSTQRSNGSIPMIGNRDVLVRVFPTANSGNTARPPVRLRLFQNGTLIDSITVLGSSTSVPASVDTATVSSSWNVIIPAARVVTGVALQLEVDPDDFTPETSKSNNRWPGGSGTSSVPLQAVPDFDLRFVPVKQSVNGTVGAVTNATKDTLAITTLSIFPIARSSVTLRGSFTTSAPVLQSEDNNSAWGQILGEISALRVADNDRRYYVGIVPVNYGSGIAGVGYIGLPAAIAWDHGGNSSVIAHEVGHNFGRNHAPCGGPSGVDGAYPYADAVISTWGVDVRRLQVKPPTQRDLMSYCSPSWISDYTYLGVLGYRDNEALRSQSTEAIEGLMIWGRVVQGNVILEPAIRVHAPVKLPARAGANRIEGFDAAGHRLFQLSFDGELVSDLPGGEERHFAYVVPLSEAEQGRLASLRLRGAGLSVRQEPTAALRAAAQPAQPTVTISAEGAIQWSREYPMAVIRDAGSGEILAFARGGTASVDPRRAVMVDLSNGVNSVSAHPVP